MQCFGADWWVNRLSRLTNATYLPDEATFEDLLTKLTWTAGHTSVCVCVCFRRDQGSNAVLAGAGYLRGKHLSSLTGDHWSLWISRICLLSKMCDRRALWGRETACCTDCGLGRKVVTIGSVKGVNLISHRQSRLAGEPGDRSGLWGQRSQLRCRARGDICHQLSHLNMFCCCAQLLNSQPAR